MPGNKAVDLREPPLECDKVGPCTCTRPNGYVERLFCEAARHDRAIEPLRPASSPPESRGHEKAENPRWTERLLHGYTPPGAHHGEDAEAQKTHDARLKTQNSKLMTHDS